VTFSPGAKRPGREADHIPSSGAKVKDGGDITPFPEVFTARCLIAFTFYRIKNLRSETVKIKVAL
jgi:hypothetical protein